LALSGGNNLATTLFLNASPYRAIFRPYRPQVQDHIGATTILTRGGYKLVGWYGLWFPARTPAESIGRIQNEAARAVNDPSVKRRFDELGIEGIGAPALDLVRMSEEEYGINKKLIDSGRIVPQ